MIANNAVLAAAADSEAEVQFDTINRVGVITLNRPRQLNALTYPMVVMLTAQLEAWAQKEDIEAVVLRGAGQKGFCAGGDIRALYDSYQADTPLQRQFFIDEYRLDYTLHHYPKPVVALMDGVVMGGGMGLAQGAHLRIVTERSRVAMPETGVGFVPDVGASYFLSKMSIHLALYLGLSGASLNAEDSLLCGLADVSVSSVVLGQLDVLLANVEWTGRPLEDLRKALVNEKICGPADAPLLSVLPAVLRHFSPDKSVADIVRDLASEDDPRYAEWARRTRDMLMTRSPLAVHATRELLLRGRRLSLADCLQMELTVIVNSFARGDFIEGVRALIVEKDNAPRWRFDNFDAVDRASVQALFEPWWSPGREPLRLFA